MERLPLNHAQNQAEEVRKRAQEIKNQKGENSREPSRDEYVAAEKMYVQEMDDFRRDVVVADEIEELLLKGEYQKALELYMAARPSAKQLSFNPKEFQDMLIPEDTNLLDDHDYLDSENVIAYQDAVKNGDELGARRIYKSCNDITRRHIDEFEKLDLKPEE